MVQIFDVFFLGLHRKIEPCYISNKRLFLIKEYIQKTERKNDQKDMQKNRTDIPKAKVTDKLKCVHDVNCTN